MKTKICPCCDQPITGIYCKGCRKIVWKPVEQEVHYYLNTRHPEHETNCSFHGDTTGQSIGTGSLASKAKVSGGTRAGNHDTGTSGVWTADHVMTPYETEAKKAEIKERMLQRKRENAGKKEKTVSRSAGEKRKEIRNISKYPATSDTVKKIVIGIVIYLILMFGGAFMTIFSNIRGIL